MKKSIFKKLASLIVAMCIVATLVPAAFADTTETGNGTIEYSFMRKDYESAANYDETYATCINYSNGNKNMQYYNSNISYGESRNGDWNQKFDGSNYSPRFQLEKWGDSYREYAAYKIKGIELYEYFVEFNYAMHSSGAEAAQVYILNPETTAEILAERKTIVDVINDSETEPVLDAVNMKTTSSTSTTFIPEASGEHLLVFVNRGTNRNVFPQELKLTPVVYPVEETTYTFDSATATSASAGVAVSAVNNFGTWGWKYLDIDDTSYGIALNKKASGKNNPRVMQHHLADLRMALADATEKNGIYSVDSIKLALAIKRPGASFYKVSVKSGGLGDVYFYLSKFVSDTTPVESHMDTTMAFDMISWSSGTNNKTSRELGKIVYSNGVDNLVFGIDTRVTRYLESLTLTPVEATTALNVDDTELLVGDTATATLIGAWTENSGAKTQSVLNTFVTYNSTNKAVATVDENGKITALAPGDTTITATVDGVEYKSQDVSVAAPTVLPEEDEIDDTTVNFKASAYEGGSVSDAAVQEVTIGTDVTVTATANDGYTFAYWKNSAGVVLSTSTTETFKVNTNMGVIAVFDEIPTDDAIPVYFYNGNGLPLGNASVAKNTTFGAAKTAAGVPAKPTLTGFVFKHWSNKDEETPILDADEITALTRAVAIYGDDAGTTFTVKNGDVTVASGLKYGESVTVNGSENFTAWKLGDKVVSYEKDYTFDVYGDITLTEVTGETMAKAPVLVLDKVGGNYFLTYDEGDYELIEAGILFGSENVSIGSIDGYKAAAKKGTGQFTAQPHEGATSSTVARGYMICKDNGTLKVIYAD